MLLKKYWRKFKIKAILYTYNIGLYRLPCHIIKKKQRDTFLFLKNLFWIKCNWPII